MNGQIPHPFGLTDEKAAGDTFRIAHGREGGIHWSHENNPDDFASDIGFLRFRG
jgi:hypothetical protein